MFSEFSELKNSSIYLKVAPYHPTKNQIILLLLGFVGIFSIFIFSPVYAEIIEDTQTLSPQPQELESNVPPNFLVKKIIYQKWNVAEILVDEKNDRLFILNVRDPHPGYGEGIVAIEIVSADIHENTYSNFKSIGFDEVIHFDVNSNTNQIYLYEFERQNILVIDSLSLQIIDEIEVHFEPDYRQRDIVVNENTNKIYLLLEDMSPFSSGTVYDAKYKVQVFNGNTKNLIKEVELNDPASQLLIDKTRNLVYADDWVEQKYFIIDNNENLKTVSIPATVNQFSGILFLNEKNNQLFIPLGNKHGNIHELIVLDAPSGKEIVSISKSAVMTSRGLVTSEKNDVLFFLKISETPHKVAIMNLYEGKNEVVKEFSIPDLDRSYQLTVDDKHGKLYVNGPGGFTVYKILDFFSTSTLGNPGGEISISNEYAECWDKIRKLDSDFAKESYHSPDGMSQYWAQSEGMFDEMIQECEEIKTKAIEEKEIRESILRADRLSFPEKVDSRCDLVYLINRIGEEGGGYTLLTEDMQEPLDALQSEYAQKVSDEPWNQEELTQEYLDDLHELIVDSIMKKYSISPHLYSAISKLTGPVGSFDLDVLRSIILLKPEHYAEDVECGKRLKMYYYDMLYQINVAAYGKDAADKLGFAIDKAIAEAEGDKKFNPVSVIEDAMENIESEIKCGAGTIELNGQCILDPNYKTTEIPSPGGACLIATATFGSELSTQVQMLREIRDNSLLQTQSGQAFMNAFNEFYYSFSPTIADYERQNPLFKEAVKLTITPLLASISLLNYVDMGSETEVLTYGISLILLNVGMYFVAPAIVISKIRKLKI